MSPATGAKSNPFIAEFDDSDGRGFWIIEHMEAATKFEVTRGELAALARLVKSMRRLVRKGRRRRAAEPGKPATCTCADDFGPMAPCVPPCPNAKARP